MLCHIPPRTAEPTTRNLVIVVKLRSALGRNTVISKLIKLSAFVGSCYSLKLKINIFKTHSRKITTYYQSELIHRFHINLITNKDSNTKKSKQMISIS